MNDTIYEIACSLLQKSKINLSTKRLKKTLFNYLNEPISDNYDNEISLAKDWYNSLYRFTLPKNANAYINYHTHVQPLYLDNYSGIVYRLNKKGNIISTPLQLNQNIKINLLFNMDDLSYKYFDVNTYIVDGKPFNNYLPFRLKKDSEDHNEIEFYYNFQWLKLMSNSILYKSYSFKDVLLNTV